MPVPADISSLHETEDGSDSSVGEAGSQLEDFEMTAKSALDQLSERVCSLDLELDNLGHPDAKLVVDRLLEKTGQSDEEEQDNEYFGYGKLQIDFKLPKVKTKTISHKEQENKEIKKFAGVYSVRSVLQTEGKDPLSSAVNGKQHLQKKQDTSSSMKPMLIELHVFPGYNSNSLTPLPGPLTAQNVLQKVADAQEDLKRKPKYAKVLKKLFYSRMSEALLQDTFWWYFVQKYQPDPLSQGQLFNRIAHNYVKLHLSAWNNPHRDSFFQVLPDLMSQAVYCAFCTAFPTSYRQFTSKFIQDLCDQIHLWMVGIKLAPRSWQKWPFLELEPRHMRRNKSIKKSKSKDILGSVLAAEPTTENLAAMERSRSSLLAINSKHSVTFNLKESGLGTISEGKTLDKIPSKTSVSQSQSQHLARSRKGSVGMLSTTSSNINQIRRESTMSGIHPYKPNKKESCPAGSGPSFSRAVFNVFGHSPLAQQFLRTNGLTRNAGTSVLVKRTEIQKLPPLSAPTYQDVIKQSLKHSNDIGHHFQKMLDENAVRRQQFLKKQKTDFADYMRRENDVLANPKEVKRLSELLFLELTKDNDDDQQATPSKASEAFTKAMGF